MAVACATSSTTSASTTSLSEVSSASTIQWIRPDNPAEETGATLDSLDTAVFLGSNGRMETFQNSQGLKICSYWYPATPSEGRTTRAVLVATHGNGVYMPFAFLKFQGAGVASTYEGSWVEALNQRGFSVCGIDMQSCGRSEGLSGISGYFNRWSDIVQDELDFVNIVRHQQDTRFSNPPLFFLGASMGGCVACHTAHALQSEPWFRGCVLLAPMLTLAKDSSPLIEAVGRVLAFLLPSLPLVGSSKEAAMRERIPELFEGYKHDPGVYQGSTRVRVALEYVAATNALQRMVPTITFPFLAVHAPEDELTDPQGSRRLFEDSPSDDKGIFEPRNMWHDLVQEAGNEVVLQRTLDWLEARC